MAKKKHPLDDIIGTREAAEELGVSPRRALQIIDAYKIPSKAIGRERVIYRPDLEPARNRQTGRPKSPE